MARIEKDVPIKQELDAVKGDVLKAVKKGSKSGNPLVTCLVLVLGAFVLFLGWFVWSVASTGLVSIPLFSSLAYRIPEPSHVVEAGTPLETLMQTELASVLSQAVLEGRETGSISIDIPESALTASIRGAVSDAAEEQFTASRVQVAVLEDRGLEVFLPLANNDNQSAFTFRVKIGVEEDGLHAELQDVRLGRFRLPDWMTNAFIQPIVDSAVSEMNAQLETYATVEDITYHDGFVTLKGLLDKDQVY